jgi:hypothetical protein
MNNTATAHVPSGAALRTGVNHWSGPASAQHGRITVTQPNFLTTRVTLNGPIYAGVYLTKRNHHCRCEFENYYRAELYEYLKRREQELAERNGGLGLPVFLARIGEPLICLSFQDDPAATWPNLSSLTENFVPITEMKQFCGDWSMEYGYDPNSSPEWSTSDSSTLQSTTPDATDDSTYDYSIGVKVDAPCTMSFYKFSADKTSAIDEDVQRIVDNWPGSKEQGAGPGLGAARIADVLFFVTSETEAKLLDTVVEDILSPNLQPAIAELCPYPRKIR